MIKKNLLMSILACIILVSTIFASSVGSNNCINTEKKETPLYKIRARMAINDRIGEIFQQIKSSFFGERIFFKSNGWIKFIEQTGTQLSYTKDDYSSCRSVCVCRN